MSFRKAIFWLHLLAGVVTGIVVGIMCVTGTLLAFDKDLIAWAEKDVRTVEVPAEATPLALDDLLAEVANERPELKPTAIVLSADPSLAHSLQMGRQEAVYVNPYTAAISEQGAPGMRAFMRSMMVWHRWLGADGDSRPVGKAITGASNLAFLVLLVSGMYLWFPRRWAWKVVRRSLWFVPEARGKARDWNWHNVIGFWTAPVMLVLIVSGVVISYRWAGDLVYTLAGEEAPARNGPGQGMGQGPGAGQGMGPGQRRGQLIAAPEGAVHIGSEAAVGRAQAEFPDWREITLQLGGKSSAREAAPVTMRIKDAGQWPVFSSTELVLNPFTGDVLRTSGFEEQSTGRKARSWLRYLHTGEAFGFWGKLIAAIVSAGGAVLVWTGFTMAWFRFRKRRKPAPAKKARKEPVAVG